MIPFDIIFRKDKQLVYAISFQIGFGQTSTKYMHLAVNVYEIKEK